MFSSVQCAWVAQAAAARAARLKRFDGATLALRVHPEHGAGLELSPSRWGMSAAGRAESNCRDAVPLQRSRGSRRFALPFVLVLAG